MDDRSTRASLLDENRASFISCIVKKGPQKKTLQSRSWILFYFIQLYSVIETVTQDTAGGEGSCCRARQRPLRAAAHRGQRAPPGSVPIGVFRSDLAGGAVAFTKVGE